MSQKRAPSSCNYCQKRARGSCNPGAETSCGPTVSSLTGKNVGGSAVSELAKKNLADAEGSGFSSTLDSAAQIQRAAVMFVSVMKNILVLVERDKITIPGGKFEKDDCYFADTVLRETVEEMGQWPSMLSPKLEEKSAQLVYENSLFFIYPVAEEQWQDFCDSVTRNFDARSKQDRRRISTYGIIAASRVATGEVILSDGIHRKVFSNVCYVAQWVEKESWAEIYAKVGSQEPVLLAGPSSSTASASTDGGSTDVARSRCGM